MTQPGCVNALVLLVSRIRQSANAAGIHTCRDMALASGVSKSGVDKIYRLRSYPCFDTLLAMANACNTTVHEWTRDLAQDAEAKGKRPEKGNPQLPELPEPEPQPMPEGEGEGEGTPMPEPEPVKPEPAKDTGAIDLMALLRGMNPNP